MCRLIRWELIILRKNFLCYVWFDFSYFCAIWSQSSRTSDICFVYPIFLQWPHIRSYYRKNKNCTRNWPLFIIMFGSRHFHYCIFLILRVFILPEFLSNRLQTLAQGIKVLCYSIFFLKFTVVLPDLFRIFWITMLIDVGSMMSMSGEAPFIGFMTSQ